MLKKGTTLLHKFLNKLHFHPLTIGSKSIPPFIYKTEQYSLLCIDNMQIAPHHLLLY